MPVVPQSQFSRRGGLKACTDDPKATRNEDNVSCVRFGHTFGFQVEMKISPWQYTIIYLRSAQGRTPKCILNTATPRRRVPCRSEHPAHEMSMSMVFENIATRTPDGVDDLLVVVQGACGTSPVNNYKPTATRGIEGGKGVAVPGRVP